MICDALWAVIEPVLPVDVVLPVSPVVLPDPEPVSLVEPGLPASVELEPEVPPGSVALDSVLVPLSAVLKAAVLPDPGSLAASAPLLLSESVPFAGPEPVLPAPEPGSR